MTDAALSTAEAQFRGMGSDVHLVVVGGDATAIDRAAARIEQLESRWSRFRDTSDICRLNAAGGEQVVVADDTVLLLRHAVEAWRLSGGAFDPTLLDALRAAGYDRTFDEIGDVEPAPLPALRFDRPDCNDIEIDGTTVTFPGGLQFDPGGIGKGLCADLVAHELLESGVAGVCVNMGGDLRVGGVAPDGGAWTLAIEHPRMSSPIALVGLAAGAVCTSTVLKRSWRAGGEVRHHLIDPATGAPSATDVALSSVIAGTAWQAEVLAKAALLRGSDRAFDLLEQGMAGLVVDHDGVVLTSASFTDFTGGAEVSSPLVFDT